MLEITHFDPLDDEDRLTVTQRNALSAKRIADQRQSKTNADAERSLLAGKVRQYMVGLFDAPATKVRIHPRGTFHVPGVGRRKAEIDVTPKVTDIRHWDRFPMACEPTMDGLKAAALELSSILGPWSAILAGCSTGTARRWRSASERLKSASPSEFDLWVAIMARGLTAIRSEFEYRRDAQN